MNAADWVIVCVIGVSTLLSILRGFTRESLSLMVWVLAILGARVLSPSLAAMFVGTIENPDLRELAAFGCLFLAILIVGMLVVHMLAEAVRSSALSFGDRALGMAFGFARGILMVVVAVTFTSRWLAAEAWWQKSLIIPHLVLFEGWTRETANTIARFISG